MNTAHAAALIPSRPLCSARTGRKTLLLRELDLETLKKRLKALEAKSAPTVKDLADHLQVNPKHDPSLPEEGHLPAVQDRQRPAATFMLVLFSVGIYAGRVADVLAGYPESRYRV